MHPQFFRKKTKKQKNKKKTDPENIQKFLNNFRFTKIYNSSEILSGINPLIIKDYTFLFTLLR